MDYLQIEPYKPVLCLNSDYNPIHITSWRRARILVIKNRAQLLSRGVIRLLNYIRLPFSRLMANKPTRNALFKRDNYECQYCGYKAGTDGGNKLTIDHIHPKSLGGGDSWENWTTACLSCNLKKGNKSVKESNMVLRSKPTTPLNKLTLVISKSNNSEWKQYLYT